MTARYGRLPGVTHHYGTTGFGVLGAAIRATTATGQDGAGLVFNDLDASDDAVELLAQIQSGAPAGARFYEDGSVDWPAGVPDGTYAITYRLLAAGVSKGTTTVSVTKGVALAVVQATVMARESGSDTVVASGTVIPLPDPQPGTVVGVVVVQESGSDTAVASGTVIPLPEEPEEPAAAGYATARQFIAKFGLEETVQLLADEQRLLTAQLLLDALAGAWTGSPSADERRAATEALARLVDQLATTSNIMDGYLRSAVRLPLDRKDANAGTLRDCCLALARCGLADDADNATEHMRKTAETWRAWLKDVAAGRTQLAGSSQTGEAPPAIRRYRGGQAASKVDWSRFGAHTGMKRP